MVKICADKIGNVHAVLLYLRCQKKDYHTLKFKQKHYTIVVYRIMDKWRQYMSDMHNAFMFSLVSTKSVLSTDWWRAFDVVY